MTTALRLFTIETRRTFALWLIPVAVAASWLLVRGSLSLELALWIESSIAIRDSVIFAGPLIAGAAAWAAGRERRRGMSELLATTPRPAAARDLANWAATACAGAGAYLLIALYVGAITSAKATWDGPYWGPITVGFLAMVAHAATGYAFGRYFPSRFTAPVIATLLFLGQLYVGKVAGGNNREDTTFLTQLDTIFGELRYLSPVAGLGSDVWHGIWPNLALAQAMWLAGVAAVALALVALRDSRTLTTGVLAVAALTLAAGGGAATALGSPDDPLYAYWDSQSRGDVIPYQPVCAEGEITICVHPAFKPWLDDIAETTNQVIAPLAGLPGMPERAEQGEGRYRALPPGVVEIYLYASPWSADAAAESIIRCAVMSCNPPAEVNIDEVVIVPAAASAGEVPPPPDGAKVQEVIHRWLWRQAGLPAPRDFFFWTDPRWTDPRWTDPRARAGEHDELTPYVDRFAALSPGEQRTWLEAHYADLRAGKLTLDDLP